MVNKFSQKTKNELIQVSTKNTCCKESLLFGMLSFCNVDEEGIISLVSENEEVVSFLEKTLLEVIGGICDISYYGKGYKLTISDEDTLISIYSKIDIRSINQDYFVCKECKKNYFRGVFLVSGTIFSPEKYYRLEIKCPKYMKVENKLISEFDINFSSTTRRNNLVLFLKNADIIQDFLNYIGATNASFSFINKKIEKEFKNNTNRQNNFDLSNIKRATDNANNQTVLIRKLFNSGYIETLSDDLKQTAVLRVENPDLSLQDLASIHNPPITKSGLNHRLKKLVELANI